MKYADIKYLTKVVSTLVFMLGLTIFTLKNFDSPIISYSIVFTAIAIIFLINYNYSKKAEPPIETTEDLEELEEMAFVYAYLTEQLEDAEAEGLISFCEDCEVYHLVEKVEEEEISIQKWANEQLFNQIIEDDGAYVSKPLNKISKIIIAISVFLVSISIFITYGFTVGLVVSILEALFFIAIMGKIANDRAYRNAIEEIALGRRDTEPSFKETSSKTTTSLTPEEETNWTSILSELEKD